MLTKLLSVGTWLAMSAAKHDEKADMASPIPTRAKESKATL